MMPLKCSYTQLEAADHRIMGDASNGTWPTRFCQMGTLQANSHRKQLLGEDDHRSGPYQRLGIKHRPTQYLVAKVRNSLLMLDPSQLLTAPCQWKPSLKPIVVMFLRHAIQPVYARWTWRTEDDEAPDSRQFQIKFLAWFLELWRCSEIGWFVRWRERALFEWWQKWFPRMRRSTWLLRFQYFVGFQRTSEECCLGARLPRYLPRDMEMEPQTSSAVGVGGRLGWQSHRCSISCVEMENWCVQLVKNIITWTTYVISYSNMTMLENSIPLV